MTIADELVGWLADPPVPVAADPRWAAWLAWCQDQHDRTLTDLLLDVLRFGTVDEQEQAALGLRAISADAYADGDFEERVWVVRPLHARGPERIVPAVKYSDPFADAAPVGVGTRLVNADAAGGQMDVRLGHTKEGTTVVLAGPGLEVHMSDETAAGLARQITEVLAAEA